MLTLYSQTPATLRSVHTHARAACMQVTPDYLQYQLWSIPTHITGALAHSLTTSSLLQAVGISAGPVGATATAAAIKWILKVPLPPATTAHHHAHKHLQAS